jgi:UDP-N-acetylmuramate: L-alanyl-gamma-D-glutamyl-meso-diaminopimelate ligase
MRSPPPEKLETWRTSTVPTQVCDSLEAIIAGVKAEATPGTQIVVMSNGGFGGVHGKLLAALAD